MLSENEIITMSALFLNNYTYIVRDKDDGLWAYDGKPTQYGDFYDHGEETNYSVSLNDNFFQQIQWGNVFDIKFELSKIEGNRYG